MPKFMVTLKDPGSEQRRRVTLSRVPCPSCANNPIKRGGYTIPQGVDAYGNEADPVVVPPCKKCDGRGDVPATRESAAAYCEAREREYVQFRLDDPETLARYPMSLPANALEIVEQTVLYVPEDTHTVDNRFLRAGKVVRNENPDPEAPRYHAAHKGWLSYHNLEKPYKVMEVGDLSEMMAVTGFAYGLPIKAQYNGAAVVDWDTNTIKTSLHTAYTVNQDTHDFFDDVSATEVSGTNYTAGGTTLTTAALNQDTATDQIQLDADNASWPSSTISATDSITYKSTGTASTSPLLCTLDFGGTVSTTAGTFQITWDVTGILVFDYT